MNVTWRAALIAGACGIGVVLGGCATRQSVDTTRLPDGSINLKCQGPLSSCLAKADSICRGASYEVLRARDQRDHYGSDAGSSRVEVRSSEATVRCASAEHPLGPNDGRADPATAAGSFRLKRPDADANGAATAARACVPGTTQACIGPGKCEGGQSCLPDGSAYGPCDCGTLGPPVTAPSTGAAPSAGTQTGAAPGAGTQTEAGAERPPSSTGPTPGAAPAPQVPGAAPPASPLVPHKLVK